MLILESNLGGNNYLLLLYLIMTLVLYEHSSGSGGDNIKRQSFDSSMSIRRQSSGFEVDTQSNQRMISRKLSQQASDIHSAPASPASRPSSSSKDSPDSPQSDNTTSTYFAASPFDQTTNTLNNTIGLISPGGKRATASSLSSRESGNGNGNNNNGADSSRSLSDGDLSEYLDSLLEFRMKLIQMKQNCDAELKQIAQSINANNNLNSNNLNNLNEHNESNESTLTKELLNIIKEITEMDIQSLSREDECRRIIASLMKTLESEELKGKSINASLMKTLIIKILVAFSRIARLLQNVDLNNLQHWTTATNVNTSTNASNRVMRRRTSQSSVGRRKSAEALTDSVKPLWAAVKHASNEEPVKRESLNAVLEWDSEGIICFASAASFQVFG